MHDKARVALVLPRFSRYGGVEQFVYRLAEALAPTFQVDVLCARAETDAPDGVRVVRLGRPLGFRFMKLWWFVREADKAVAAGRYDLVMGFGSSRTQDVLRVGGGPQAAFWKRSELAWPAGLSRLGKRLRRVLNPASWLTARLDDHQYTATPRLVCVSHAVRDWVLETYPGIPEPEVIYNLPDLTRFRPPTPEERHAARRRFGFADNERVITTATTNFRLKATASLIRALRLLADAQAPQTVLAVAGGRASGSLLRLARKLDLENRVRFLGKVDDMPALYHASDLFALPSYYDACSNAVLEARASGLAVLSSAANGSSRFLPAAWVVDDPGDAADLATRMEIMSRETPPPFALPEDLVAGIPAWVALVEREVARKRGPLPKGPQLIGPVPRPEQGASAVSSAATAEAVPEAVPETAPMAAPEAAPMAPAGAVSAAAPETRPDPASAELVCTPAGEQADERSEKQAPELSEAQAAGPGQTVLASR